MSKRSELYGGHVAEILATQRIAVQWTRSADSTAWRHRRCIKVRRVVCPATYAYALHEIGHIIGPYQSEIRFVTEIGAWLYARQEAIYWSRMMTRTCAECLDSYHARYSSILSAKLPMASDPIWQEALDTLGYTPQHQTNGGH